MDIELLPVDVIVKAPLCVCTENTAQGSCQEANTAQGEAECCICLETHPLSDVFCVHKHRQCCKCFCCTSWSSYFQSLQFAYQ